MRRCHPSPRPRCSRFDSAAASAPAGDPRDLDPTASSRPRLDGVCTVVIDVAGPAAARLLAVRDEDPLREWDALGEWWPEQYPGVTGIRDRRAGGAWLAVNVAERRLAVLLNRADVVDLAPEVALSRGSLALESVTGRSPAVPLSMPLPMHGFNLLEVRPEGARV